MFIYKNSNIKKIHNNSVIAIGNFDGLHLGHQKVLKQAKQKAKKNNSKFGLVTFEPIPTMFFKENIKNHRINSLNQKINYLKKLKLDFLIIINFNKLFSNISSEDFIKKILVKNIKCKYVFVSQNFRFGKKRHGDINTLRNLEKKYFYKTIVTSPYQKKNKIISSTLIRKIISKGNIEKANKLLGRAWSVEGEVIKGRQIGRKIGFPTCNIKLDDYILPRIGVYSVKVEYKNFKKKGIANLGYRPTFGGKKLLLEVNIFGIKKNLYKKILKVSFIKLIRPEKKFKNINELKLQIKKDILIAKK
ncbi:bifunctional riboflavin kinase/FAD synthetase [Pelagibacteraceae bacterium]|jgi:riboflavin kinase/FMN adenylyltransferase|nr:bifunctional riboflavin kinase/FAD synthetase [Pelagibacteraceae bacterium]